MRSNCTLFCSALLGSALALSAVTTSQAAKYAVLHRFAGSPNDGGHPVATVAFDASGNAYGTTESGGSANIPNGTIYKISPDGTEAILHSFGGTPDGGVPNSGVTIDQSTGDLYGATAKGGASGYGTIWKYAADGTYSVLHSFDGVNEGNIPVGTLVRDGRGNLYGTAQFGGANDDGTVFEYSAKGKFAVLHSFAASDGQYPEGSLIRDKAGNLYGVTEVGGTNGIGSVYRIGPDGSFATLYSFPFGGGGAEPMGGLALDNSGNLYGTTSTSATGYGTVFKLAPDGTLTTLYSFTGGADGGSPQADLLLIDTDLYGTTAGGGNRTCRCGVVFKLAADATETVLHTFKYSAKGDGTDPYAGLAKEGHRLYGTTFAGGTGFDYGTLFSVGMK